MKKLLSMALALVFVLTLASCGKSGTSSLDKNPVESAGSFVKPEQYASVLLVTINPQFRLYLDENGNVLAVEAVNKDAESMKDSITFENQNLETVIETIITEANKSGFVKEDATINFEIVESKEADEAQSDILSKAEKMVNDTANELQIEIKVNISEPNTSSDPTETDPSDNPTSTETEPSDNPNPTETEPSSTPSTTVTKPSDNPSTTVTKPSNPPTTTKPTHTHSFAPATCTEPKKCSCGAVEGAPLGHDYKDGVCTRCKAKDPNYKPLTSVLQKQGKWTLQYLQEKELFLVSVTVCKPSENSASVDIGALLSTLPSEMQNDPSIKEYCKVFNGEEYYIGKGDGDGIKTIKEENGTVTLTDSSGHNLVLARTGENTLKCTSAPDKFAYLMKIPVGAEFTFVAD